MEQFLSRMIGKKLDVSCTGRSGLRGEVVKVESGILCLRDDDQKTCYVAIDKIVVVWEVLADEHRAGFVSSFPNNK